MKRFSFLLLLAVSASIALFTACQKENLQQVANPVNSDQTAGERAPLIYGVSLFTKNNGSLLHTMDAANGQVINSVQVYLLDANNNQVFLNDLKGVCTYNGQVWVTTGFHPVDAYSYLLVKVNPQTGQAGIISHGDPNIGAVSDIDYSPTDNTVYGLASNTNRLITITDNNNNWGTYTNVGPITGMGNYTAKGLSMVRDNGGDRIVIAGTQQFNGNAQVYTVGAGAGAANFLAVVNPAANLAAGHCAIGFDIDLNAMLINRNNGSGLNSFGWANPLPNPSGSGFWGGNGINFEDLSSDVQ